MCEQFYVIVSFRISSFNCPVKKVKKYCKKMSTVRTGRVGKHMRGHRVKSGSVLRMMAIMQDRNSEEVPKEFLETGRTGRRNAMPDILHPQGAEVTTADLPSRLQQLVTTDMDNPQPCSSKTDLDTKKCDDASKKDSCS